jgi:hypothetical protein
VSCALPKELEPVALQVPDEISPSIPLWGHSRSVATQSTMRGVMTIDPACLDSSYLVALFDSRDTWHEQAAGIQDVLRWHHARTITPDCVVSEVLRSLHHMAVPARAALVCRVRGPHA